MVVPPWLIQIWYSLFKSVVSSDILECKPKENAIVYSHYTARNMHSQGTPATAVSSFAAN